MGRQVPLSVALLLCSMLVAAATLMTVRSVALAADGPYYLVRILGTHTIFGTSSRYLGNAVREGPVLIGVWLGLTDTHALSILLGVGMLIVPALVWSFAIVLARPRRLAFASVALTAGLCAGTTWYASISESALSIPLAILVAVLLWRPAPWDWGHAVSAVLASFVLVATYETALLTGAVLAVWAAWRSRRARSLVERSGSALVAMLSLLSVAVALSGVASGSNSTHSRSLAYFVVSLEPWPFYLGLAGVGAMLVGLSPWLHGRAGRFVFVLGCGATIVAATSLEATPATSFEARGGAVVAGLALQLFLFWWWATGGELRVAPELERWSLVVPIVLVAAFLAASARGLTDWSRSLDAFRREVGTVSGVRPARDALRPDERAVLWGWTSSSLSLLVRPDRTAGLLVDRDPSVVAFPPALARRQLADTYTWRS